MRQASALVRLLWRHKLTVIAALIVLGLSGGAAGIAVGLTLEENDEFCASCHTQPEYDYWMRTVSVRQKPDEVSDLATFHSVPAAGGKSPKREALKCISCHGGPTTADRVATMLELGVRDTIKFIADDFKQPAKLSKPLPNAYCVECHREDVGRKGFENHFHNKLEDAEAPYFNCTACHVAHAEADALNKFVLRRAAFPQCNECHKVMGGPTSLQ